MTSESLSADWPVSFPVSFPASRNVNRSVVPVAPFRFSMLLKAINPLSEPTLLSLMVQSLVSVSDCPAGPMIVSVPDPPSTSIVITESGRPPAPISKVSSPSSRLMMTSPVGCWNVIGRKPDMLFVTFSVPVSGMAAMTMLSLSFVRSTMTFCGLLIPVCVRMTVPSMLALPSEKVIEWGTAPICCST